MEGKPSWPPLHTRRPSCPNRQRCFDSARPPAAGPAGRRGRLPLQALLAAPCVSGPIGLDDPPTGGFPCCRRLPLSELVLCVGWGQRFLPWPATGDLELEGQAEEGSDEHDPREHSDAAEVEGDRNGADDVGRDEELQAEQDRSTEAGPGRTYRAVCAAVSGGSARWRSVQPPRR